MISVILRLSWFLRKSIFKEFGRKNRKNRKNHKNEILVKNQNRIANSAGPEDMARYELSDWELHWTLIAQLSIELQTPTTDSRLIIHIQSNLSTSNTDGSFTMANSNSFLSPYEILPIAQENKYLRKLTYYIIKLYVVCTHKNRLVKAILMSAHNIPLLSRSSKKSLNCRHLLPDLASWLTLSGSNYPYLE